jgi:hypothetical protein
MNNKMDQISDFYVELQDEELEAVRGGATDLRNPSGTIRATVRQQAQNTRRMILVFTDDVKP